MSAQANRELILRFYGEVWNRGNVDVASEIFADDYVRHDPRQAAAQAGGRGQAKIAADFRRAFPDLELTVDVLVADDEHVAARWTMAGTHTGRWGGIAPTGRTVVYSGANFFRIRRGKVIEIWNHRDDLGLREQLGVAVYAGPAPEAEG
ncbi:MAG: ester cyclase [Chloroflexi bacterium]|nr:ester cyclase [Chloroflexota bacterium]